MSQSETVSVDDRRPLDAVLAAAVVEASGGGFALRTAQHVREGGGTEIVYRVEKSVPPHDEWLPPAALGAHRLHDVGSLVTYARKYGTQERSLVVYNDQTFVLYVDDLIERGHRHSVTAVLRESDEWRAWTQIMAQPVDHRTLLRHLLRCQHTLTPESTAAIDRMRQVKASFTVNLDSDLRLDAETAGVVFKAAAGDCLVKFPRELNLHLPVLDVDVTGTEWRSVPVMIEVNMPTNANESLTFSLISPTWAAVRRDRSDAAARFVQGELEGWTVVRGDAALVAAVRP